MINKKIFQKIFLILAIVGAFFAIAHTAMAVTQFQVQYPQTLFGRLRFLNFWNNGLGRI